MSMFVGVRLGELHQLTQQQRVLEDALDRLNQVRFKRAGQLLARVARTQEFLQVVGVVCRVNSQNTDELGVDGRPVGECQRPGTYVHMHTRTHTRTDRRTGRKT